MTNQESIMGMVLSSTPVGDYDKRLVILTKEHGKITAFAKGARRPNCALLACGQPFVFGTFRVYQGKNAYTLVGAEISNYFEDLRFDLDAVCYGLYFCEFVDFLSRENVEGAEMLKLLYQSLRALSKKTIPFALIRYIFEFKIMALNGEALQVYECIKCQRKVTFSSSNLYAVKAEDMAKCGKKETDFLISVEAGGLVCGDCWTQKGDMLVLEEATVYTLQFIVATPIETLYTFHVNDAVLLQLSTLSKRYLAVYVGHTFKSLCFLEN